MLAPNQDRPSDQAVSLSEVHTVLRGVLDPEIGINIVDLGLVYEVERFDRGLKVVLIMTTPACPLGSHIVQEAEHALRNALPSLEQVEVRLNQDIAWTTDLMSEAARQQLGLS